MTADNDRNRISIMGMGEPSESAAHRAGWAIGRRTKPRLRSLAAGLSLALLLAACSSSTDSPERRSQFDPGTGSAAVSTPDGADSTSEPAAPTADLTTADFTMSLNDGTQLGGSLTLTHVMAAGSSEAEAAWTQVGGTSSLPCDADPDRDGVFVGTIGFTNDNSSFSARLDMQFKEANVDTGTQHSFAVQTSDGAECSDFSQYPNHGDVKPSLDGAQWGPVPIEIVVKNYYSPASPDGDPNLLGSQDFYFVAFAPSGPTSSYIVKSTSDLLETHEFVNGPTYVRLASLA